ncbi:hypothetical protein BIW11_04524 [Tropilaelaps mercedesae]|uniref:Uncharacterized protein n=1 Tax=Tropilaelaps mercedesae TaxID=418985 RepID=A0A1V9X4U6_9ACAR|nr:hypothetical protein BIW11_04524 [Tropilaelaps mercedesae]
MLRYLHQQSVLEPHIHMRSMTSTSVLLLRHDS